MGLWGGAWQALLAEQHRGAARRFGGHHYALVSFADGVEVHILHRLHGAEGLAHGAALGIGAHREQGVVAGVRGLRGAAEVHVVLGIGLEMG